MGETISFLGNGKAYPGYLSRSLNNGPGVIVIQEWWGLVGHIKDVADRFAAEGFTALAPDFYDGKQTTEPDEAGSLMMALNIADAEKVLRGAITRLQQETSAGKVGVIGFCMGGQLSLLAATTNPEEVGACVNFYGIHPNVKPDFSALRAPILGLFAGYDEYASPSAVAQLDAELSRLEKAHEFHTYPESHHAFFNTDRPEVYDPVASTDAWNKVIDFLTRNLTKSS